MELKDKSSIVSYSVSDEPVSLALSHHPDEEKVSFLGIVLGYMLHFGIHFE